MLQWRIAWREMRGHPGRSLLTLLSVVIGAAAVLSVGLSTGSARRAYRGMSEAITGRAALQITGAGGEMLDAALLDTVRQTRGVEAAVPLIERYAIMYCGGARAKVMALGIDPSLDAAVRDYDLVQGQPLSEKSGSLLDASLARNWNIKAGDQVKLLVRRGFVKTTILGLVQPRSGAGVMSGGALFMPLSLAQRRFAAPGRLDRIQITLAQDARPSAVQAELERRCPAGVRIQPPNTRSPVGEEMMLALENGLRLATAFSLLAAVFIIMNAFLMNVGQRRPQLAVMRAVGATRKQVAGLLVREALLMGIVGTLIGAGIGLAGAKWLNVLMGGMFQTSLPPVELRPWPLILAAAFGIGASLLGAALPTRQAARVTPHEGMSGIPREDVEGHWRRAVVAGLIATILSIGLFLACFAGWLPLEASVAVTVLALIGLVLLLPLAIRPLTYLCQLALRPAAAVEARLARGQLLRHSGRTTLTVGVLFIAVSTGLGLANSIVDNVADVRHWYRTAIIGDFFVRAAVPDMATGLSAAVPATVGQEIQKIDGVTSIGSVRFVSASANGQQVVVVAMRSEFGSMAESDVARVFGLSSSAAEGPGGFQAALRDGVTVGSVFAQRSGLKPGDCITLDTRNGPRRLPIAAVQDQYAAGGLTITMRREQAEQLLGIEGVDIYAVQADHAKLKQVEQSLQRLCAKHGMLLQSYADLTRMIEGMMAGVVGSLWGLLTLGLIVAAFGVVNTLGRNVLEQTRELGLLRVVAMTRGQVRKAIVAQAAMLGLLGVAPGLLAGGAVAYVMSLSSLSVIGHAVGFKLHPLLMAGGFLVAMAMVLAAAWVPAERAARLQLATALRYE